MRTTIGLIAGEGRLPVAVARRVAERGDSLVVVGIGADSDVAACADHVVPLEGIDFPQVMAAFHAWGVRQVVMAGRVPKGLMFASGAHDATAEAVLHHGGSNDDHTLLGRIVAVIEGQGFPVAGYREIAGDLFVPLGYRAGRNPTDRELEDCRYGREIAAQILGLSFGQTVVVADRAVLAVEAMEGTDAAIRRAGQFGSGGGTVVKMMRPDQDERFDIPVVGLDTLQAMHEAGLSCLAVEAGRTIVLDRERMERFADDQGIALLGIQR
ncbi:MAG: UDP-2,3-diacylglucosamine diphosphatase LpxI [Synergistales bacterium]|nr:UDP-2,3-diacylglucosamine diphosphatase LpxI [Synergistales bacterium]